MGQSEIDQRPIELPQAAVTRGRLDLECTHETEIEQSGAGIALARLVKRQDLDRERLDVAGRQLEPAVRGLDRRARLARAQERVGEIAVREQPAGAARDHRAVGVDRLTAVPRALERDPEIALHLRRIRREAKHPAIGLRGLRVAASGLSSAARR